MITEIIAEFEKDRAYIAREMSEYDEFLYGPERDREKADKIKNAILAKSRAKKESNANNSNENSEQNQQESESDKEKEILASELDRKEEEIEKLKEEQKMLRALASSGIVLASFSHDLSKLNDVLASRTDKLRDLMLEKITEEDYAEARDSKNPFKQLERIKKQDTKLQNWLNFSLGATRKDKRKRKQLFLKAYFENLKNDWQTVFEDRGIILDTSEIEDLDMRVFEIDIDSIFNNMLVNSIDAFIISKDERDTDGSIIPKDNSKEAKYMFSKLQLGLIRYRLIWKLEEMRVKKNRIKDAIENLKNKERKPELLEIYYELDTEFMKYLDYLSTNQ